MYSTTIDINGWEIDAEFHYIYYPTMKGKRDGFGVNVEPDEPAHVEIASIYIKLDDGKMHEIDLPECVRNEIELEILEEYQ